MDPLLIGFIGIILLFVLLFSGMPLGPAFVLIGTIGYGLAFNWAGAMSVVRTVAYATFSDYGFIVIPLFILMGTLAFQTRMSEDLYDSAHSIFGRLRGGLAMATVAASAGFAAICGASVASAATMGKVAYPEMRRYKYDDSLSTASICVGGTLGILIPPSVMLVVYGPMANLSVGKLFFGAFMPGFLLSGLYMAYILIRCQIQPHLAPPVPASERAVPAAVKVGKLVKSMFPPTILILAVPPILPLANQLGINLVHLGSIMIVNIGLGVMTPPFAMSIFVGSRLSGVSAGELIPPMMRYLFCVGIPVLLLTTYIPFLSCWLPTLALGTQIVGPW